MQANAFHKELEEPVRLASCANYPPARNRLVPLRVDLQGEDLMGPDCLCGVERRGRGEIFENLRPPLSVRQPGRRRAQANHRISLPGKNLAYVQGVEGVAGASMHTQLHFNFAGRRN